MSEYQWPTAEEAITLLGLKITPEQFIKAFRVEGPALVSFSGGRTSGLMLWCILVAHGGALPADVIVTFANTGKEREETLRFVHECGIRWGVSIRWVEWRDDPEKWAEVGFNSASREGEPFSALVAKRGIVPNSVARFCSVTLKVRAMREFVRTEFGWKAWRNIIGLRADEGWRVMKALARNESNKEPFKAAMPLAKAGVKRADVLRFWLGDAMRVPAADPPQGFDLGLRDYEGNCDLCFLKSRTKLLQIERETPGRADWWAAQERAAQERAAQERAAQERAEVIETGARFRLGDSYELIARDASRQGAFPFLDDEDEHDAECGLWCAPDGEAA